MSEHAADILQQTTDVRAHFNGFIEQIKYFHIDHLLLVHTFFFFIGELKLGWEGDKPNEKTKYKKTKTKPKHTSVNNIRPSRAERVLLSLTGGFLEGAF